MKIVGGSFGLTGSAFISGGTLTIDADRKADYAANQLKSVVAEQQSSKAFGFIGALVGAVLLSVIFSMMLGPLGVLAGVCLAIAGSFYTTTRNLVSVEFIDGCSVVLECTPRAVTKLVRLKG